jgi:Glycosyltransferases involved in cell wall biogenesis
MSELVSVIIPTFNRAVDLTRALGSLRAQTYTNWEAVVVDNESTDGTGEMIAQLADPRVTFLSIRNNGVIAASRNKGLRDVERGICRVPGLRR